VINGKPKAPSFRRSRSAYREVKTSAEPRHSPARPAPNPRLFSTPEAKRIKKEICAVGHKLWLRQFVDGNGGNVSYRIGPNEVICTPTMLSKFDLRPRDLCMVDLDGNQVAGTRAATSEILLHLEIYKKVPEAKAAVHCHPHHATAYAITGLVPPTRIIPEYEIFIGKVAVAPYETPGTQEFAETVLPFVKEHNAILLGNHGVVTWADTPTLAEWHCEILETYCAILAYARQLSAPVGLIPDEKCKDLVARRERCGFPGQKPDEAASKDGKRAAQPVGKPASGRFSDAEIEALIKRITRQVLKEIGA
jgi:L-fuculose-phosphate aldolase